MSHECYNYRVSKKIRKMYSPASKNLAGIICVLSPIVGRLLIKNTDDRIHSLEVNSIFHNQLSAFPHLVVYELSVH